MPSVQRALAWSLCVCLWCLACRAAPPAVPIIATARNQPGRRLHGRFLQITDVHPDPFYKTYSSTESEAACHRHKGPAGLYGAETAGCDSPISLVNETFKWIEANLKDQIDFVVWTGDSARHDNDEKIPRTEAQIIEQNEFLVTKFTDVFGKDDNLNDTDPTNDFVIPIVPTFGNNDIMPHNIFRAGPNKWTLKYLDIWRNFIPEEQRHQFQRGGWFYVEVIPHRLAVISLNTIYFFDSNPAVDGCAVKGEPGYEHMDWLRIQLQMLRERGMKAILMGHVPPARTENKLSWDETCWQKFTLWQRQYRDIIVASLFGHMNIDHFILQDSKELGRDTKKGRMGVAMTVADQQARVNMFDEGEVTVSSASDYLLDLRSSWAKLPSFSTEVFQMAGEEARSSVVWRWLRKNWNIASGQADYQGCEGEESPRVASDQLLNKLGGRWGERFSVSLVSPSVVPNYFPTLRVFEYNTTGLESLVVPGDNGQLAAGLPHQATMMDGDDFEDTFDLNHKHDAKKGDGTHRTKKKQKKYKFKVPSPPSKSTPPGPAYSPQTLTLTGYVQYFANLTHINNDFTRSSVREETSDIFNGLKWKEGKHRGKESKHDKPYPKKFKYEVEYNTTHDKFFQLKDLTVMSYIELAAAVGHNRQRGKTEKTTACSHDAVLSSGKKKKKKGSSRKKPHREKCGKRSVWLHFIRRAFVDTMDADDIKEQFCEGSQGGVFDNPEETLEL